MQTTGFAPVHTPLWQVSARVHAFASLHAVPFDFATFEQTPVVVLHAEVWHASLGVHTTGFDPIHTPLWQVSACVQALASLQVAPLDFTGFVHRSVVALHVPALWHWSVAGQLATQLSVLSVQFELQLSPLPVPQKNPELAHVAPPRSLRSQASPDSRIPFPQVPGIWYS